MLTKKANNSGQIGASDPYAVHLVRSVCRLTAPLAYLQDVRARLSRAGVIAAVRSHNTSALFDWFAENVSLQGISDEVAIGYMRDHGRPSYADIAAKLNRRHACPRLRSYWHYFGCGYRKAASICAEPHRLQKCCVPTHDFRNGRLNQTAYSLFLFLRDVAGGDFVRWIDERMDEVGEDYPNVTAARAEAVIGPLRNVYGLSDKVLNMTLAELFIGTGSIKPRWLAVGAGMIAVDTLVHNFLIRTGILPRLGSSHPYGAACYAPDGCADIIHRIASAMDARDFGRSNPPTFPRLIQNAIWRFCAQGDANVCNGNRIDDKARCANVYCRLYVKCDRQCLMISRQ